MVPIAMMASVFTVHFCFRRLYLKDQKILFWILLLVSIVIFVTVRRAFNYYYTYPLYFPEARAYPFFFLPKFFIEGASIYLVVGVYAMAYFVRAWYEQQRLAQELRQQKTDAELQLLRSQVHPHFIFNTLNNIYSHALQKNDDVPELIHRLSSFLSYNLYDTQCEKIDLVKELEYIQSYIALEKLRYGDRLDVAVNVYDPLKGIQICPLLLLPIVENCFKHGVASSLDTCWIRLDVMARQGLLTINVENSIGKWSEAMRAHRNGLGLENVRKRLAIIYPGRHELKVVEEEDSYMTTLKITIP